MLDRILGALGRLLDRIDTPPGRHRDDLPVKAVVRPAAAPAATIARTDAPADTIAWDDGPVSRTYTDARWLAAARGRTAARDVAAAGEAAATGWHQAAYRHASLAATRHLAVV